MRKTVAKAPSQGFSLVELMVGLLLSTFLIGGVIGVYLANSATARVNEQLSQVQQASQVSFQLLSKDLQHAGYSGCANIITNRLVNVLNAPPWWGNWNGGVRGFEFATLPDFSGGVVTRVAGTDGLQLMFGRGVSAAVVAHQPMAAAPDPVLIINENAGGIVANDVVLGCDSKMAVLFKVTAVNGTELRHDLAGVAPQNLSLEFGINPTGGRFVQAISADVGTVMALETVGWMVGELNNSRSLFRVMVIAGQVQVEEVVPNIDNFQLQYLQRAENAYVDANNVNDWTAVVAVQATLTLAQNPAVPLAANLLQIRQVINLRNRRQ